MGVEMGPHTVAGGINSRHAGFEVGIRLNAPLGCEGHPHLFQPKPFDPRLSAHGQKQAIKGEDHTIVQHGLSSRTPALIPESHNLTALNEMHPVLGQRGLDRRSGILILPHQDPGRPLHQGHRGAQPSKCLRQLASNGAAPKNQQPPWVLLEPPKRFGGPVFHRLEPGDGRDGRLGPARDHDVSGRELLAVYDNAPRARDPCIPLNDLHPQPLISLRRIVRGDGFDHAVHAGHHLSPIHRRLRMLHAEALVTLHIVHEVRRPDEGLGGDAPGVQAVSPHRGFLDEGDPGLHGRRDVGRHQPCSPGTNHDQITVKPTWARPPPKNLPPPYPTHEPGGHEREEAQQGKGAQNPGRQDAGQGLDPGQLRAGIHINRRPGEHSHLTHQKKGDDPDGRERHGQIHDKKREDGNEADHEQIAHPVPSDPLVQHGHGTGKPPLHSRPKEKSPDQKGERRPRSGSQRDDERSPQYPEKGPAHEREDCRSGERQPRHRDVDAHVEGHRSSGVGQTEGLERGLLLAQELERQKAPQIEGKKEPQDPHQEPEKEEARTTHESGVGAPFSL